ncbi:MAG: sugar transferase [Armatimonadetes bacterium]|nr:sugar transferase [Armatimonadota bacterium]
MRAESVAVQPAARDEASKAYEWLRRSRRVLALMDGAAACIAMLALLAMSNWRPMADPAAELTAQVGVGLILLLTLVLGLRNGQYTSTKPLYRLRDPGKLVSYLAVATSVVALLAVVTNGFFVGSMEFSRLLTGSSLLIFLFIGGMARVIVASRQRALFLSGVAFRKCLVLGSGQAARDFVDFVSTRPWLGVACVGRLEYHSNDEADGSSPAARSAFSIGPTYEGFDNLDRVWCASGASEIVVALDPEDHRLLAGITKVLSLSHVPFRVVPSLFEESYRAAELLGYGELPVVDVDVDPLNVAERMFKRVMDMMISSVVLVIGFIPGLLILLAISLDSRGPVFYKQQRVGKNGRRFGMYKFRTMVVNADQLLDRLKDKNEKNKNGQLFKMKDDPRITRVGRFLRKWSLDEVPQIINVIKGEMSWVGPRPPLPREVENYESEHYCRLKGLPGMTGLWQVSGRSNLSFEQMVKLDKYYLDNWSLRMDLAILVKTVLVVLARRGAY